MRQRCSVTVFTLQWLGLAWDVKRAALAGPESLR